MSEKSLRDKRLGDPFKSVRKKRHPRDQGYDIGKSNKYTRSDRRKAQDEINDGLTEYFNSRMDE